MTAEEMLYRVEVAYDFITGFSAAGISKKEWSLLLSEAQMDVIKMHLPSKGNELSFEETELLSEQFSEIITDAVTTSGVLTTKPSVSQAGGVDDSSIFYDIPNDFLYGLSEKITYKGDEECIEEKEAVKINDTYAAFVDLFGIEVADQISSWTDSQKISYLTDNGGDDIISYDIDEPSGGDVVTYYYLTEVRKKYRIKPITHNYYVINKSNPHKKPYKALCWRLKAESMDNTFRHEIIAYKAPKDYFLRYLKTPSPIIIFDDDYDGDTDTIQGITLASVFSSGASMNPVFKDSVCDLIVNRAVVKAQIDLGDVQAAQVKSIDSSQLN